MRTRFIRTSSQPWGVTDRSDFSVNDHAALRRCNKLLRATLRITRVLDFCQIPWFLENPYSSMTWKIPALRRRAQRAAAQ
eukprot:6494351-Pyramimonas_sp.AAC.1